MDKTKTIDRIRKLMELAANNPSSEEAKLAALAAQRLMAEHDISEFEVASTKCEEVIESRGSKHRGNIWQVNLGVAIADNFRCVSYVVEDITRTRGSRWHKEGTTVVFVGRATDAEAARITYDRLYEIGDRLASRESRRARAEYGTARGVRNSFLLGFVAGIRSVLDEQCVALKLVMPEEVERRAEEITKGYETYSHKVRGRMDGAYYEHGVDAGRQATMAGRIEA